ncbi:hypothetical protein [Pedobacter alluvionis]|uniref:Uncharacterized protein n=1 Tax=Pedobacter alluvionis TaxID=475253 RepID=A0A497XTU8_9SPHI|nr:hypothetical protein [Pedobacter alluvionis]RLJ72858.1 hypothetical protein BCL90_4507 [Pedobacter alluvionis]
MNIQGEFFEPINKISTDVTVSDDKINDKYLKGEIPPRWRTRAACAFDTGAS